LSQIKGKQECQTDLLALAKLHLLPEAEEIITSSLEIKHFGRTFQLVNHKTELLWIT